MGGHFQSLFLCLLFSQLSDATFVVLDDHSEDVSIHFPVISDAGNVVTLD